MSDTDSEATESKKRGGCCGKAALGVVLLVLVLGGYALWAASAMRSPEPLPFEPFGSGALERAALTAKLELSELPSRVTGGSAEVELDERQLNQLLLGGTEQTDEDKARVRIEGDQLRLEASRPLEGGDFLNVVASFELSIGPEQGRVKILDGSIGSYDLGPVTRPWIERAVEARFAELRANDPQLQRIKALWVEEGAVRMVYEPE